MKDFWESPGGLFVIVLAAMFVGGGLTKVMGGIFAKWGAKLHGNTPSGETASDQQAA